MDEMDERRRTKSDGVGRGTEERIRERVRQLEMERDQFALLAPVRAEERMQALQAQLQMEISMRIAHFDSQIETLKGLLAEPAKEVD